jgi:hypothetical protein
MGVQTYQKRCAFLDSLEYDWNNGGKKDLTLPPGLE